MANTRGVAHSLWKACVRGNSDKVAYYIKQGVDVTFENNRPLRAAFNHGHHNIVWTLLNAGADINLALRLASRHGQESMVVALLASSGSEHCDKFAALQQAAFGGHLSIVSTLLSAGADPNSALGSSSVICYAIRGGHDVIADYLLCMGAEVSVAALREAATRGNLRLVTLMINSPRLTSIQKRSAAYAAATAGHASVVQLCLNSNLVSQLCAADLVTHAVLKGHSDVVSLLLPLAQLSRDNFKQHIEHACMTGHLPIVRLLWEAGYANGAVERPEEFIESAADCRQHDIVEFLLLRGFAPPVGMWRRLALLPHTHHRLVHAVQPQHFRALPEHIKSLWLQVHLRVRVRLAARLWTARANLDRPPTVPCGKAHPTREELVANLRTGGRRFAREYWAEGAALFVKGEELGEVPEEFKEVALEAPL